MTSVVITGCDAGLGRAFAQRYAADGYDVHATYRDIANRIDDEAMHHHPLDVTDASQIVQLSDSLAEKPIDILVSNAGIGLDFRPLGDLDFDYLRKMFEVNTVGPLRLVEALVENVARSERKRIAIVSSRMGSISLNLTGGHYGYRASKAALNAVARSLTIDLARRDITLAVLHPGWVSTAGGGPEAPLTADYSVAAMCAIIDGLGAHETGEFYDIRGNRLPW